MCLEHLALHALLVAELGALVREGEWWLSAEREHDFGLVACEEPLINTHNTQDGQSGWTNLRECPV